jgi:hypothetical protein
MGRKVQAPRVKSAIKEIIEQQGDAAISVEQVAQKLRESYAKEIVADQDDLISYGLGVAIGRVSSRPVQDPVIRDLFGDEAPHEFVNLRGADGGKVHIGSITPAIWKAQPPRTAPHIRNIKTSDEIIDEIVEEMMANGVSADTSIVKYLKQKKR